jgi:energy-coupling factor transporter ATP-binding protein EcfA2
MNNVAEQKIINEIWTYFRNGLNAGKAKEPNEYLTSLGFDKNLLEIGFNSGQFHHRKTDQYKLDHLSIGLLKPSTASVRSPEMVPYTCIGSNGIVFPLKDITDSIVNFQFIRFKLQDKPAEYLNENGVYPCYPHHLTERLFIVPTVLDAATIIQSKILGNRDAVMALHGSVSLNQHQEAIDRLTDLKQIVCIGMDSIDSLKTDVTIVPVELQENCSLNDMLLSYGGDGLLEYINDQLGNQYTPDFPMDGLQVINEQRILFEGKTALFEVRGYLPADLGKMEIGLFVQNPETSHLSRHRVDLYNEKRVKQLCGDECEKNGYNVNLFNSDVTLLINLLDIHRDGLTSTQPNKVKIEVKKELTPSAEKKAIEQLKRTDLLSFIDNQLELSGIVGEESVRTTAFVIGTSYKMPKQLHAIVQGESGSGKTHLINTVADCLPTEDVKRYTRITERALQNMEEKELINKCVIFQDLDGLGYEAQFALRELQSAGIFESSVASKDIYGNSKTISKIVHAKMSSLSATTKGELYYDNMTRSVILGVDESEAQTQRILDYHNNKLAGIIDPKQEGQAKQELRNMVRMLKQYPVKNPFAHLLQLPVESKMKRRLNSQFQDFICQVTLLHQYQRKVDNNGFLLVQKEDIRSAIELFFTPILLKVDDLDSSTRQFFEELKKYIGANNYKTKLFTQVEIRKALNKSKSRTCDYLSRLRDAGFIIIAGGTFNRGFQYKIEMWDELEALRKSIKEQLLKASVS